MLLSILKLLIAAACCVLAGAFSMHLLQYKRYQTAELSRIQRRHAERFLLADVFVAGIAALADWYLPILLSMVIQKEAQREIVSSIAALVLFALAAFLLFLYRRRFPVKKPFGVTRRICRLAALCFLISLLCAFLLQLLALSPYFVFAAADAIVLLSARIIQPLENRINRGFTSSARAKLAANKNLITIGITGSYGKTDVKLILKTLLLEKYSVLATPPSFSTILGISRTVNEQLKPSHQVFIAEMGAQRKGEIKDMCALVQPQYGAISCIGPAHIDSFNSIEAIAQAKYELIQALPEDGEAFFGSDAGYGDRLYHMCKKEKFRSGIDSDVRHYMRAEHIETGVRGSRLQLICEDGDSCWVQTRLLGESHMRNLALAAAIAHRLDLSMEEIARGAEKIKPQRHQLQLISDGGFNIIDDSACTLPRGAEEALHVLRDFPGRRILVTSGLTDLEEEITERNFALGTCVPGCADYVLLIAPESGSDALTPARAFMNGMMNARFSKSAVRIVRDAEDAAALLREIASAGDSILFSGVEPLPLTEEAEEES